MIGMIDIAATLVILWVGVSFHFVSVYAIIGGCLSGFFVRGWKGRLLGAASALMLYWVINSGLFISWITNLDSMSFARLFILIPLLVAGFVWALLSQIAKNKFYRASQEAS